MARSAPGKVESPGSEDEVRRQERAPIDHEPARGPGPETGGNHPGYRPEQLGFDRVDELPGRLKYFRTAEAFTDLLARAQKDQISAHATLWITPQGQVGWVFHCGDRPQAEFVGGIQCMLTAVTMGVLQGTLMPAPEGVTKN